MLPFCPTRQSEFASNRFLLRTSRPPRASNFQFRASVRHAEVNLHRSLFYFGCNDRALFQRGYLDKGTQRSMLMAFSRSENKAVLSTERQPAGRGGTSLPTVV
jgi:hypothetical protein